MKFDITILTSEEYIKDVINTVETLLNSNESEYIVSFHEEGYNIDDSESIVIITGEYEPVSDIIDIVMKRCQNLRYSDDFNFVERFSYRTFIIHHG